MKNLLNDPDNKREIQESDDNNLDIDTHYYHTYHDADVDHDNHKHDDYVLPPQRIKSENNKLPSAQLTFVSPLYRPLILQLVQFRGQMVALEVLRNSTISNKSIHTLEMGNNETELSDNGALNGTFQEEPFQKELDDSMAQTWLPVNHWGYLLQFKETASMK